MVKSIALPSNLTSRHQNDLACLLFHSDNLGKRSACPASCLLGLTTTLTLHGSSAFGPLPRAVRKLSKTLVADDHLRAGNYLPRGIDFGTSPSYFWIPRESCFNQTRKHLRILPEIHSPVPSAAFSGPIKGTVSTCSRPAICNVILFLSVPAESLATLAYH